MAVLTEPYYRRREPGPDAYAKDYWEPKADPDGVLRDRLAEREQYLMDVAQELAFVRSLEPGRVLDFGCGLGWFLDALGDRWQRVGTDSSIASNMFCAEHYSWNVRFATHICPQTEGERFVNTDFGTFDVVFCHHVIEHMGDPERFVRDVYEVTNDDGHFILGTPDFDSPCAKRFGANYRLLHDQTHISLFSQDGLLRLLRDTGFTVDRVEYPFPDRYATPENFARWHDTTKISPPWPGNFITAYCRKV